MQKMRQEDEFKTSFCFLKMLYKKKKQVVSTLVLTCFGSPQLGHTMKTNCMKLDIVDLEIFLILIFKNESTSSFSTIISAWFMKK